MKTLSIPILPTSTESEALVDELINERTRGVVPPRALTRRKKSTLDVHFSTGKDDWCTPQKVIDCVLKLGPIAIDPCSNPQSIVPAARKIMLPEDGLTADWGEGLAYVNPPYSRKGKPLRWAERCFEHGIHGEAVLLLPARTDTAVGQYCLRTADHVCFVKGRLRFLGGDAPAPFPSAVYYFGPRYDLFRAAFHLLGSCLYLP